ncbi:MAG: response regulator [Hansschlegelia sp.]
MVTAPSYASAPIFVVDDDLAVRLSLKFMFELEGLSVRLFESGEALLAAGPLPERGCLVVDQKMARLTGIELLHRLNARRVRLPAILITGRLTDDLAARAKAAGFVAVFEKPLESGLMDAIQSALGKSRSAAEHRIGPSA